MYESVMQLLGQIVAYSAGAAGLAYVLFTHFGEKWLENKFARSLELYKSEQQEELEKLKLKINMLFNRVRKIHDKEYEVIPELWKLLKNIEKELSRAVGMFQKMPDLDRYTEDELESFFKRNSVPEEIGYRIKHSTNKISEYADYRNRVQMHRAQEVYEEFDQYLSYNRIFLSEEVKQDFLEINNYLWRVWVDRSMSLDYKDSKTDFWMRAHDAMEEKVKPLMLKIEDRLQKHLCSYEM